MRAMRALRWILLGLALGALAGFASSLLNPPTEPESADPR